MSIPREFIDLLLTKLDLVDLINSYVPLRKKSGSNYFARCPFHQEKSASFSVSQTKQFYHCFGCGAHGNAIDFLMNHDHLSFPEAIETLARQAGIDVPHATGNNIKKDDSLPGLYDLAKEVATYYYEQLKKSPHAIDYLKNRGISGKIAQQFQLGYAQPGWSHVLDTFGKSDSDRKKLLDTGLIIKKDEGGFYDRFRERIMFPILDYRGRTIGFGGRILQQGEPKYLNSPETALFQKGHELYGLYQALKANRHLERVMIVEGYMDVIALFQHGITYAVATLGTATTTHHLQRLFRYTSDIIFCFDGDDAGRNAAWRAVQVLFPVMHDSLQVRVLFLPEKEDPDSLVRKEGKEAFEKRITAAPSLSEFFFQTISKQADMSTMEGRARFAALALNHIKQLPAGIFQTMMVDDLAKRSRVHAEELKAQIKTGNYDNHLEATFKTDPITTAEPKTKLAAPMKLVLALLVQYPHLASHLPAQLEVIDTPGFTFLTHLLEIIQKCPNIKTGALLEYWRGQKEEVFVSKLAQLDTMVPEAGAQHEFIGAIRQLRTLSLDEEINRLLAKAAQENLADLEKQRLSSLIAQKKALI